MFFCFCFWNRTSTDLWWFYSRYTDKSDIFSFGVILAVLLTGRNPMDPFFNDTSSGGSLGRWLHRLQEAGEAREALDKSILGEEMEEDEMLMAVKIAVVCLSDMPTDRPSSDELVSMLTQLNSFWRSDSGDSCSNSRNTKNTLQCQVHCWESFRLFSGLSFYAKLSKLVARVMPWKQPVCSLRFACVFNQRIIKWLVKALLVLTQVALYCNLKNSELWWLRVHVNELLFVKGKVMMTLQRHFLIPNRKKNR